MAETQVQKKKQPIMISHILIGINVLVFLYVFINGGTTTSNFIKYGAKYNYGIYNGEYYRLLTSMFLHGDITHLLFNSWALFILGRDVETIFGKSKFLVIYFAAGLIGSVFSFLLNDAVGVGASGGIFGLLGAHIYLYLSRPEAYKRVFGTDMFVIIGFNLIYGFMKPNIDSVAHIAGMVGGCIAAFSVGTRMDKKFTSKKGIAFILSLVLIFGGLILGINHFENSADYYIYTAIDQLQNNDMTGLETLYEGREKFPDDETIEGIITDVEAFLNDND